MWSKRIRAAIPLFCLSVSFTHAESDSLRIAEDFISAFYTFEPTELAKVVDPQAEGYVPVMYYQGWAQGGNYQIKQRRACQLVSNAGAAETITCAITVTDDFGGAMGYVATDTFALVIEQGRINEVSFSADDPPIFQELLAWIGDNQPHVLAGPCADFFAGGETPQACAQAVAHAARRMMAERGSDK